MNALSVRVAPVRGGWAVALSDGQELARFYGPAARWRAMRYLARFSRAPVVAADRAVVIKPAAG